MKLFLSFILLSYSCADTTKSGDPGNHTGTQNLPLKTVNNEFTDAKPFLSLLKNGCQSFKNNLSTRYDQIRVNLCNGIGETKIDVSDIYFSGIQGEAIKIFEKKEIPGLSHLGYILPMFAKADPVDFFEYLQTGVMKKGIGTEEFDLNVKAYDFIPQTSEEDFVTSSYHYKLDYSKAFGDIQLKKTTLGMDFDWLYLPDEEIFMTADMSQEILENGLFKNWGLYIFFVNYEGNTLGFAYLDMTIANLGIHEVIKGEYLALANKLPPMLFRAINRIQ